MLDFIEFVTGYVIDRLDALSGRRHWKRHALRWFIMLFFDQHFSTSLNAVVYYRLLCFIVAMVYKLGSMG